MKQEVVDLVSDVEKIKESQKSSEKLLEVSPVDLAQDVRRREWSRVGKEVGGGEGGRRKEGGG